MPYLELLFSSCQRFVFTRNSLFALVLGVFGIFPTSLLALDTTTSLAVASGSQTVTTIASGSVITLTAAVSSGGVAVTRGRILFCDTAVSSFCSDVHKVGEAQLTTAGTVALKFFPGAGNHGYMARFVGTAANGASNSSVQILAVTAANATQTTLSYSGQGNGSLVATIAATGGAGSPTGSVGFQDVTSNQAVGSANVGPATFGVSFTSPAPFTVGASAYGDAVLAKADFNGDGKADLVFFGDSGGKILLGNGDGTFTPASGAPQLNAAVAVGDFNGDGKTDLVVASNPLTVLLGNGDGTFQTVQGPAEGYLLSVATGDFNGDGIADVAVSDSSTVRILLGNGTGAFTETTRPPTQATPTRVVVGDFNGDGKADLAVENASDIGPPTVSILLGAGNGTFTAVPALLTGTGYINQSLPIAVGDVDGDGNADIVIASQTPDHFVALSVFLGKGDGTFTAAPVITTSDNELPTAIALMDFNGDGRADLVLADFGTISLRISNGDGTFTVAASTTGATTDPDDYALAVGDFNDDGVPDIAVQNPDVATGTVLLTHLTETTTATLTGFSIGGTGTHNVEASYGGDASFSSSTSNVVGVTAMQIATTLALASSSAAPTYGSQIVLTATLSPYVYQSSSTNGETVTFYSGSTSLGTGTLQSGVAMLNSTSLPVGATSLTAVYGGDTIFAGASSSPVSVTVAPAVAAMQFSVANQTFGAAPFAVLATSNSSGAISYSVVSGPATVSGSTVTLTGAGTVVLKATQAASGTYAAGSQNATFTVAKAMLAITLTSSANPVLIQTSITLTATVSAAAASGTVSFLDGTTALGSGSLVNGVASLAVSTLTAGSHAITAVYSGDSNFAGVSSSALSELVQDFSLSITGGTATGTSQTVSAGGTATYKIDVAPVGGNTFPSAVSFAVTGLPTGATATFSPQTIAAGGGETTVTLTIQVPTQTSMMLQDRPLNRRRGEGLPVIALGCAMLPFAWARRRNLRSGVQRVAGLGILAAMMLVAGCAGNSSSTTTTQAKTYTLSMTASSGTLSYKTALTLIVQ